MNKLENKLASAIGIISRVRFKLTRAAAILLYDTLVLPHLNYCTIIWGSCCQTVLNKCITLQRKVIRLCWGLPRDFSSVLLFKTTNKLSINDIFVYQMSSFVYLWIHNELPAVFKNVFCRQCDMHVYNTRNPNKLVSKFCKNIKLSNTVSIQGPKVWNTLPIKITELCSIESFQCNLKKHLISLHAVS